MKIYLIGSGGVGKSTVGLILSERLKYKFIDLDAEFVKRYCSPGKYIDQYGYDDYCTKNSELFFDIQKQNEDNIVVALSSGFLVYNNLPLILHKNIQVLKDGISILLMPSRDYKTSEKVIISRQLKRGFGLNSKREKEKIRARFEKYIRFDDIQIFSTKSPPRIASQIIKKLKKYEK